jgi:hypothetical protein
LDFVNQTQKQKLKISQTVQLSIFPDDGSASNGHMSDTTQSHSFKDVEVAPEQQSAQQQEQPKSRFVFYA